MSAFAGRHLFTNHMDVYRICYEGPSFAVLNCMSQTDAGGACYIDSETCCDKKIL